MSLKNIHGITVLDMVTIMLYIFFFFNDTATTEIYTLSLHDALPISSCARLPGNRPSVGRPGSRPSRRRSEEHTSELQSLAYLVCRLLLEKKKKQKNIQYYQQARTRNEQRDVP